MKDVSCYKCQRRMQEGHIPEQHNNLKWFSGAPQLQKFFGIETLKRQSEKLGLYIKAYRCAHCGLLEFYAPR